MSMTLDPGMAQYFVTELKHTWCRPTSRVTRVHAKVTVNTAENLTQRVLPRRAVTRSPATPAVMVVNALHRLSTSTKWVRRGGGGAGASSTDHSAAPSSCLWRPSVEGPRTNLVNASSDKSLDIGGICCP